RRGHPQPGDDGDRRTGHERRDARTQLGNGTAPARQRTHRGGRGRRRRGSAMSALVVIRTLQAEDIRGIIALSQRVYSGPPWTEAQLQSHLRIFPEGQFVAIDPANAVVGYAASLIIYWDDYDPMSSWRDFTDGGMFTNHDPVNGRTLYAAEVMVDPSMRSRGIGGRLYTARKRLARRLNLLRIRAGAR